MPRGAVSVEVTAPKLIPCFSAMKQSGVDADEAEDISAADAMAGEGGARG